MKPSDLFINNRQFFGYLISGLIWTTAAFLIIDHDPQPYLDNWFYLICFILGSYIVGFSVHGTLFRLVRALDDRVSKQKLHWINSYKKRDKKFRLLLKKIRGIVDEKNILESHKETIPVQADTAEYTVSDNEFEQYCKRYVLECSSVLSLEVIENEATINFIGGLIPSLSALALGYAVFNRGFLTPAKWGLIAAMIITSLWLFFLRLPKKRTEEKWLWLEAFMTLRMKSVSGLNKTPEKKLGEE